MADKKLSGHLSNFTMRLRKTVTAQKIYGLLCLAVLTLSGCSSIGPGTIERDRFDYTTAVADSWKSQMLLNLVKIRYGDTPVFLDVGQVVASYSLQRKVGTSAMAKFFNAGAASHGEIGSLGLSAEGALNESPTITYSPMTGERFARQMMMPIPPAAIMNIIQAGYPVDMVFRLTVQSLNGIDNRRVSQLYVRPADPEFYALLPYFGRIQASGDIGVQVRQVEKNTELSMILRPRLVAAEENAVQNIAKILNLDPTTREFRIVYGAVSANEEEIAMLSRSIIEILTDISSSIIVPDIHVTDHWVTPTPESDLGPQGVIPPMIRIKSSVSLPADAFVAVPYKGHWFSISNADISSKRMFSFLMFLFTFVETGNKDAAPILTIPTSR
jgi:hypothetical protein